MAKHIFKKLKLKDLGKPIAIDTGTIETPATAKELETKEEIDVETSIEELENELEEKRKQVEKEIIEKKENLDQEIDSTRNEAENWAFEKVKEANKEYETKLTQADSIAKKKIAEAEKKANILIEDTRIEASKMEEDTHRKGYEEGHEKGYNTGKEEVERLITRLNIVLSSAIKKRNEIIEEAESQLIDLVIVIARKVVKSISETQKRVVFDNISEALKKLKGRAEITIRVNSEDLQMTTKHKKEFIEMVEGIEQVKILEDNTVEKGGCYITTDFGSIDARISTQLSEIEEQIKKLTPLKEDV